MLHGPELYFAQTPQLYTYFMNSFDEILLVGGHKNSLGRAEEVVRIVLDNPVRLDELYKCISNSDAWVRMRAIDAFEKLCRVHPGWALPYADDILENLTKSSQPSIQWHIAQLVTELKLSKKQINRAVGWLIDRVSTVEVDWIVSANAMRALIKFESQGYIQSNGLQSLLEIQQGHKSKSVRKKATEFLSSLNNE